MSQANRDHIVPEYLKVGEEVLPLLIRRHSRAKRICLRYNPTQHAISLTLPKNTHVSSGLDFLVAKSEWLVDTLGEQPRKKQIKPGAVIPLLGERIRIRHDARLRGWLLDEESLTIGHAREEFHLRASATIKNIARNEITELAERYAAHIGKRIARISVRDTRSRWGSCSSTGSLNFSWRLVFAPREVMEYVVAHEVAHLRHMNHSAAFWALVEFLCPDYEVAKEWLRLHGKHLYRFNV